MPRLNEFELIDVFLEAFPRRPSPFGPGDDAAVLPPAGLTVVTTDALVEGVHFTRRTFDWGQVGHKALAVNLSDVAAMGAKPTWALAALQLPSGIQPRELRELGAGVAALAAIHEVSLIGGNLTRGLQLSVTLTVCGAVPKGQRPLTRGGAKPGHRLYLSGPVGGAAAGLAVLHDAIVRGRAPERRFDALTIAQRTPSPHVQWGLEAARFASAGIDVSDGLVQDLQHLCAASEVGAEISTGALPVLEALLTWAESEQDVHDAALRGGEDYVLLVSVPPAKVAAFERRMRAVGLGAFPIGVATRKPGVRVDGRPWTGPAGFQHFVGERPRAR